MKCIIALFNYNKWESVKSVLHGLGRLNVAHLIKNRVKSTEKEN